MRLLTTAKDFIKAHPRLYDFFNQRRTPDSDLEQWLDAFSRHRDRTRFIQIGASDGLRWDPLRHFVLRDKWRGLFVEPLPGVFPMLQRNYAPYAALGLACVNAAITTVDGELTFWMPSAAAMAPMTPDERLRWLGQASITRAHVERALGTQDATAVAGVTVPALTFRSLLAQHWVHGPVDLVVIDAEGYDDVIVQSIDLDAVRPEALVFEVHNLPDERKASVFAHLAQHGYAVTHLRGDAVAVRSGHAAS